jgi:hypothetical protein
MKKMIASWFVLIGIAGAALAQTPAGSAADGSAPAAGSAAAPAPATADAQPAVSPAGGQSPVPAAEARKLCTAAMNADREFAASIVKTADEAAAMKRDADTVAAHVDANARVQKNERHVIYAYAAMWILAAGFVLFLWRRQQALKLEIGQLRRDLEAAAADARPGRA